jgi:hypothetical protein
VLHVRPWRCRGTADHELGPERHVPWLAGRPVQPLDDRLDGQLGHLGQVLSDGGEVDAGESAEPGVVVADDGQVLGDVDAGPDDGVEDADGTGVVGRDDRGRQWPGQQLLRGIRALVLGVAARNDVDLRGQPWSVIYRLRPAQVDRVRGRVGGDRGPGRVHRPTGTGRSATFLDEVTGGAELPANASFAQGLHNLLVEEAVVRAATGNRTPVDA